MKKSKLFLIIYRSVTLLVGLFAILISVNVFSSNGPGDFYIYFTNLSNYACIIYVAFDFVYAIRKYLKGEKEGFDTCNYTVKFCLTIAIMLTFVVANFILFNIFTPHFWDSEVVLSNLFLHFGLPLLFMSDFFVLTDRHHVKWYAPICSLIFPLTYVAVILIRGAIVNHVVNVTIYPYFFLNVDLIGAGKVALWIVALAAAFLLVGYAIYCVDHFVHVEKKEEPVDKALK